MGPAQGLVDAQGASVVPLHLLELALVLAEQGQVVELLGHVRVVGAQDLGVVGSHVTGVIQDWHATQHSSRKEGSQVRGYGVEGALGRSSTKLESRQVRGHGGPETTLTLGYTVK